MFVNSSPSHLAANTPRFAYLANTCVHPDYCFESTEQYFKHVLNYITFYFGKATEKKYTALLCSEFLPDSPNAVLRLLLREKISYGKRLQEHCHKNPESEKLRCDRCRSTFAQGKSFIAHLRYDETREDLDMSDSTDSSDSKSPNSFKCDECSKLLKTAVGLKRHKKIQDPADFVCPNCDKAFAQKDLWTVHVNEKCPNGASASQKESTLKQRLTQHRQS